MKSFPQLKKRLEELKLLKKEQGRLDKAKYEEFCALVNELVREARRERSSWLDDPPETYLERLFASEINKTVKRFMIRKTIKNSERPVWRKRARDFFRTVVLGDWNERHDRTRVINSYLEKFQSDQDKLLTLNYLWEKSHRDALLGQKGKHKPKDCLSQLQKPNNLDRASKLTRLDRNDPWKDLEDVKGNGFLARDRAAIDASREHALKYKMWTKRNPYWDEPTGYDPDYKAPELRSLLEDLGTVNRLLASWARGEFQNDFASKADFLCRIEDEIIGISLKILEQKIAAFPSHEPDFMLYLFGARKPGKLYRRLLEYKRYVNSKSRAITRSPEEKENEKAYKRQKKGDFTQHISPKSDSYNVDIDSVDEIEERPWATPPSGQCVSPPFGRIDPNTRLSGLRDEVRRVLTDRQVLFFEAWAKAYDKDPKHAVSQAAKALGISREGGYRHRNRILPLLKAAFPEYSRDTNK